jgi:uncharacterized protein
MAMETEIALMLVAAGFWAGAQNALAGGGSIVTMPALMLAGLDVRVANLTSSVALFPGQIAVSLKGHQRFSEVGGLPLKYLLTINIVGGAFGAALLLWTPSSAFALLVPWLVLFATLVYAWSSFRPRSNAMTAPLPVGVFVAAQIIISIYGGYYGGGNSFLMLAVLSVAGIAARQAGTLKNMLIALINLAAVVVFCLSSAVAYQHALALGAGAMVGSLTGGWVLGWINLTLLRLFVVTVGLSLTAWLFWSSMAQ